MKIPSSITVLNCTAIVFSFFVKTSFCSYCPVYRTLAFKGLTGISGGAGVGLGNA